MAKRAEASTPERPGAPTVGATGEAPLDHSGDNADIAAMSYEQARDELVDLVARLENGQAGLEESMALWQRGETLADHCSSWLDRAEARITADD